MSYTETLGYIAAVCARNGGHPNILAYLPSGGA
jgi:hypothetical protein